MNASTRLLARLIGPMPKAKVKHYQGLPPRLTDEKETRIEMESPSLILIEQKPDGVFLYRYMADGRVVGDTWHTTVDEAKAQASYEYGGVISPWRIVPPDIVDVTAFGLK